MQPSQYASDACSLKNVSTFSGIVIIGTIIALQVESDCCCNVRFNESVKREGYRQGLFTVAPTRAHSHTVRRAVLLPLLLRPSVQKFY